mmetsp:Transcript_6146/g.13235  ORF Transcript_6146/g.13235 Transcript_6146/m.13235 type:complete len:209 (-) Transcript_6146:3321-3947(-)
MVTHVADARGGIGCWQRDAVLIRIELAHPLRVRHVVERQGAPTIVARRRGRSTLQRVVLLPPSKHSVHKPVVEEENRIDWRIIHVAHVASHNRRVHRRMLPVKPLVHRLELFVALQVCHHGREAVQTPGTRTTMHTLACAAEAAGVRPTTSNTISDAEIDILDLHEAQIQNILALLSIRNLELIHPSGSSRRRRVLHTPAIPVRVPDH